MKYQKKQSTFEARQLTFENSAEIIEWCNGRTWSRPPMRAVTGVTAPSLQHGSVHAGYGDILVKMADFDFEVYVPEAFALAFDPVPDAPLTPVRDLVLAERIEQKPSNGIYLTDFDADKSQLCRVLAVGPGVVLDNGVIRPAPCKAGDVIYTTPNDGHEVTVDGRKLWVFEAMEVVAILTDEDATAFGGESV